MPGCLQLRFAVLVAFSALASAVAAPVTVPFVGCPSDGMGAHSPAPEGKPVVVDLPPEVASRLAFYQSDYTIGVLGPRGWHCNGEDSSGGFGLYLSPRSRNLKSPAVKGPFIELWEAFGETSGRFQVAQVVARYFPKHMALVKELIADDLGTSSDFPTGPYPDDQQIKRNDQLVEYVTPPHKWGLGTSRNMHPGREPVHSIAMLDPPGAIVLSVRLPKYQSDLAPIILRWAEQH